MALRDRKATASYNFVPLPAAVIKSPIDRKGASDEELQESYRTYVTEQGALSG